MSEDSGAALRKCEDRLNDQLKPDLHKAVAERQRLDEQIGEYEALKRELAFLEQVRVPAEKWSLPKMHFGAANLRCFGSV